ncbi:hypothetical protein ACFQHO_04190 [Actinomadura yumaensis]|uniref:hypothetical protein n=1 Tax=Actinomadura yumaensis TaxID=111807 RepID=UPI003616BBA3
MQAHAEVAAALHRQAQEPERMPHRRVRRPARRRVREDPARPGRQRPRRRPPAIASRISS